MHEDLPRSIDSPIKMRLLQLHCSSSQRSRCSASGVPFRYRLPSRLARDGNDTRSGGERQGEVFVDAFAEVARGAIVGSLALTWVLNRVFNVQAFFLFIPLILPFVWRFDRNGRTDD